jgi:hypothetical protein
MAEVKTVPTIDLGKLYEGRGKQTEVADFVAIQHLLSNPAEALPHLQALNDLLATAAKSDPLPEGSLQARARKANDLLQRVLAPLEEACGFEPEQPVLVGFASADDFKTFTREGRHFYDVGARSPHGELSHRIQWFVIMRAVTGGTFDTTSDPYRHTMRELFAASLDDAYVVPSTSFTKVSYMWDWIVDRISGLMVLDEKGERLKGTDYDGARDAWTHPGEDGAKGALSNDIMYNRELPGIDVLREVRVAQYRGNAEVNKELTRWYDLAVALGRAEGRSATTPKPQKAEPTYFYMPTPEMVDVLVASKQAAAKLIATARKWAGSADAREITGMRDAANKQSGDAYDALHQLGGKNQRLAPALLGEWFGPLTQTLTKAAAETSSTKGRAPGPVVQALLQAAKASESSGAWTFALR